MAIRRLELKQKQDDFHPAFCVFLLFTETIKQIKNTLLAF
ncbi:hypothetical protein CHK_0818 [Christensenella hongkongensis]|uniref:Uncharacterized protein n=1 Tax=Christensenella hongkongensis TaxID=270498 RepID=A0A0M2NL12_9FIRM|nr:hypothetical protein CHK_0818 [Christensenella hongkongensis]